MRYGWRIGVEDLGEEGVYLSAPYDKTFDPGQTKECLRWLVLTKDMHSLEAYTSLAEMTHLL